MWEFNMNIHTFEQVQNFVALATAQPFDVSVGNAYQKIDGKDLMGMFSLDFTRPLKVTVSCGQDAFSAFRANVQELLK